MFTYFLFRTFRHLRGRFNRAKQQGSLSSEKVFRATAVLFLFLAVFSGAPATRLGRREEVSAESQVEEEGQVAGTEQPFALEEPHFPRRIPDSPEMEPLSAKAALVLDQESGKILYEKNAHEKLLPASTTKIMTALVSLENCRLSEIVSVPPECLEGLSGRAQMGLFPGEKIAVEALLYGLLLNSASDAACVLASHGRSRSEFVELMNQKAQGLGLSETQFSNPVGLDEENHFSSAWDLLVLAREAMKNPEFRKIVGNSEIKVHDALTPPTRWHALKNTNILLGTMSGITGVKTGRTEDAGECLIASWFHEEGEIFAVLLGSEDRFSEMRSLFDWVKRVYSFNPSEPSS